MATTMTAGTIAAPEDTAGTMRAWTPEFATARGKTWLAISVVAGASVVALNAFYGTTPFTTATLAVLAGLMTMLGFIDARTGLLPNIINLVMFLATASLIAGAVWAGELEMAYLLKAALAGGGTFAILWLVSFATGGIGYGDVKTGAVAAMALSVLGGLPPAEPISLPLEWMLTLSPSLAGALLFPPIIGVLANIHHVVRMNLGAKILFGPYLSVGALLLAALHPWIVPAVSGGYAG